MTGSFVCGSALCRTPTRSVIHGLRIGAGRSILTNVGHHLLVLQFARAIVLVNLCRRLLLRLLPSGIYLAGNRLLDILLALLEISLPGLDCPKFGLPIFYLFTEVGDLTRDGRARLSQSIAPQTGLLFRQLLCEVGFSGLLASLDGCEGLAEL